MPTAEVSGVYPGCPQWHPRQTEASAPKNDEWTRVLDKLDPAPCSRWRGRFSVSANSEYKTMWTGPLFLSFFLYVCLFLYLPWLQQPWRNQSQMSVAALCKIPPWVSLWLDANLSSCEATAFNFCHCPHLTQSTPWKHELFQFKIVCQAGNKLSQLHPFPGKKDEG